MGAGASTNPLDLKEGHNGPITYQQFFEFVTKQKTSAFLNLCDIQATFNKYQDPETKCITKEKYQELIIKTDVFLTHDWGEDELKRNNHDRVSKINSALKLRGFETWFDDDRMIGRIDQQMVDGIDNTSVILVFITKRYMEKINGTNPKDNCQKEFTYAENTKTSYCDGTKNDRYKYKLERIFENDIRWYLIY